MPEKDAVFSIIRVFSKEPMPYQYSTPPGEKFGLGRLQATSLLPAAVGAALRALHFPGELHAWLRSQSRLYTPAKFYATKSPVRPLRLCAFAFYPECPVRAVYLIRKLACFSQG
jgi:hypothetical protein